MGGRYGLAIARRVPVSALALLVMPYPTRAEAGKRAAASLFAARLFSPRANRWSAVGAVAVTPALQHAGGMKTSGTWDRAGAAGRRRSWRLYLGRAGSAAGGRAVAIDCGLRRVLGRHHRHGAWCRAWCAAARRAHGRRCGSFGGAWPSAHSLSPLQNGPAGALAVGLGPVELAALARAGDGDAAVQPGAAQPVRPQPAARPAGGFARSGAADRPVARRA